MVDGSGESWRVYPILIKLFHAFHRFMKEKGLPGLQLCTRGGKNITNSLKMGNTVSLTLAYLRSGAGASKLIGKPVKTTFNNTYRIVAAETATTLPTKKIKKIPQMEASDSSSPDILKMKELMDLIRLIIKFN
jgi:hypothetical protein